MIRYLTPSKIGLLVLIVLYTDGAVPNDAIIPVLSFITSRLIPQPVTETDGTAQSSNPSLSLGDFENVTKGYKATMPGRTLYDVFLQKLWSVNSLHAMHAFFHDLHKILTKTRQQVQQEPQQEDVDKSKILLSRVSPVGVFVRRTQLEFMRLQFDDSVKLWVAFAKFREGSENLWKKKRPSASSTLDSNLAELNLGPDHKLVNIVYPTMNDGSVYAPELSTEEMERMLDFQLERLQRFGNRLPDDVRDTCQSMLKSSAASPSLAHFVRFFDAWRAGDYTTSFESLHRYFDYTMHTRDRSFYQYALLHMAILQADFGCFSEAVAAMNETISTARENQDMSCLNFSLSWLNHLSKAYPSQMKQAGYSGAISDEREGLAYLKTKAKEMKLPNLLSSTLLSEAKMILSSGEGISQAFERIYQSSHLNVLYNIQNSFGTQLLVQSSIYGRLGFNQMAESYCDILLDCYSKSSPSEEILRASCRKAYTSLQSGQYKAAMSTLDELNSLVRRNLRSYQYLSTYCGLMKLKHALRKHDLTVASILLTHLVTPDSTPVIDPELSFQIELQRIEYLQKLDSYDLAYDALEDLAEKLKNENADIYQRIHVMVMKAILYCRIGKPQKGFTVAMRAANAAWQAKILPALWEAWGTVANILGTLGEYDAQRKILDAIIPQALGSGDFALCAQLYIWQADACMGLAGQSQDNQRLMTLLVSKADTYIDRAAVYYKRIEDIRGQCDTLHKKSIIAKLRGDTALAEDWAGRYITLYNAFMNSLNDDDDMSENYETSTLEI